MLTKIINSFMHMFNVSTFVSAKYQIAPSKAVVGFERSIKALSRHIQKPYKVLIAVILSKKHFFSTRLLHAYVQCVYIVKATDQIAPLQAVVGVDRPMKAPSMHIQKP